MDQWKIRVNDVYPAYITWETFERIQAMLHDNYAEYERTQTRGIPRPGAALLQGMVYCGECGHKLAVQYKGGTHYVCNALRQRYRAPVCQYIPADPVDLRVVEAFFQAFAPIELDVYAHAVASHQEIIEQVSHAHEQHLQRLHYEAALAERQFLRVDPDNRLVAAELEKRWEEALTQLRQAEQAQVEPPAPGPSPLQLSAELRSAFQAIGQHLPALWRQGLISQPQKKALLRCLIDKVVVHRPTPETVQARLVWRGGETTTLSIPVPVGAFADLAGAKEMEQIILLRSAEARNR